MLNLRANLQVHVVLEGQQETDLYIKIQSVPRSKHTPSRL